MKKASEHTPVQRRCWTGLLSEANWVFQSGALCVLYILTKWYFYIAFLSIKN